MKKFQLQFNTIFLSMSSLALALAVLLNNFQLVFLIVLITATNLWLLKKLFNKKQREKSLLLKELSDIFALIWQSSIIASLVAVLIIFAAGLVKETALLFVLSVICASIPSSVFIIFYLIFKIFKKKLNIKNSLNSVDIGSAEYIICEFNEIFIKKILNINEIKIGKDIYKVNLRDEKYNLINQKTGAINPQQINNLQLFFNGISTTKISEFKELAKQFIDNKSQPKITYKSGEPKQLLSGSDYIWDHGHIRKMSPKDRIDIEQYILEKQKKGLQLNALKYTELGAKGDIFMSIIVSENIFTDSEIEYLKTINSAHVKLIINCQLSENEIKYLSKKLALPFIKYEDLNSKSASGQLNLIAKGALINCSTAEQSEIIKLLNNRKKYIVACSNNLKSQKALEDADLQLAVSSINNLTKYIIDGRVNQINFNVILRSLTAIATASMTIVFFGITTLLTYKIAPALTPSLLIVLPLIIIPVCTAIAFDYPEHEFLKTKPKDPEKQIFNLNSYTGLVGFGLIAAILAYLSYLLYFERIGISAVNLTDLRVPLYHAATTQGFLTLCLCSMLFVVFERADNHKNVYTDYLFSNPALMISAPISLLLVVLCLYTLPLQNLLKTTPLNAVDWLVSVGAGVLYIIIRQIQRYTRKHTRKAIIELQKELTKPRRL